MSKTNNTRTNRVQGDLMATVSHGEKSPIECTCGRMLATWGDIDRAFLNGVTTMFFPDCPCGALIVAEVSNGEKWPASAMELLAALTVTNIARKAESAPSAELFALGRTVATAHAVRVAEEQGVQLGKLIFRHQHGDWGDIHAEDRGLNEAAIRDGERIFSVYQVTRDLTFWVITEWDRSYTTVMLPEDY